MLIDIHCWKNCIATHNRNTVTFCLQTNFLGIFGQQINCNENSQTIIKTNCVWGIHKTFQILCYLTPSPIRG